MALITPDIKPIIPISSATSFAENELIITYSFCLLLFLRQPANGLRYPRWGGGRRSRPARKMIRRVKLFGMCAESPASGARFVGWRYLVITILSKRTIAELWLSPLIPKPISPIPLRVLSSNEYNSIPFA